MRVSVRRRQRDEPVKGKHTSEKVRRSKLRQRVDGHSARKRAKGSANGPPSRNYLSASGKAETGKAIQGRHI